MGKIDELGFIDSVFASNKIAYKTDKVRIFIGKDIPYEISKGIITVLSQSGEIEIIQQVLQPDFIYNTRPDNFQARSMIIGSRKCPYVSNCKYIRDREIVEKIIKTKSKEEFDQIVNDENEEEINYQKYLRKIDIRPKFAGCEEINDVERRLFCSHEKLKYWLDTHLKPKFVYGESVGVRLQIDETGNVVDLKLLRGGVKTKKNIEELKLFFYQMPKWIPAIDQIDGKRSAGTAQFYFKL